MEGGREEQKIDEERRAGERGQGREDRDVYARSAKGWPIVDSSQSSTATTLGSVG